MYHSLSLQNPDNINAGAQLRDIYEQYIILRQFRT